MAAYVSAVPAHARHSSGFSAQTLMSNLVRWRQARRSAAQLKSMPDHILDDLGLSRADIDDAILYGRRR